MSYELRLVRYTLMFAMTTGSPPYGRKLSLQQAANEMVRLGFDRMSRERVRQVVGQGAPRKQGDDGSSFACGPKELERRIRRWKSHGTKRAHARAEAYRKELEEVQDLAADPPNPQ